MALYSAGVEYGIHCLLFLADEKGDSRESSVRTLAELQGVPPELLAKVFTQALAQQTILDLVRRVGRIAPPEFGEEVLRWMDASREGRGGSRD